MRRTVARFSVVRLMIFAASVAVFVGWAGLAQASITLTLNYTGDNVVSAFFKDGAAPSAIDISSASAANSNWQVASAVNLNGLNYGTTYDLFFQVHNVSGGSSNPLGSSGNPAAFLAEITGPATGGLLTSSSWQWALDATQGSSSATPPDPLDQSSTWAAAKEWKYLQTSPEGGESVNGGNNIWTSVNGGAVAGLSTSAHWIWSDHNGEELGFDDGEFDEENYIWLRTTVTTAVPEPTTLVIWALLGAFGVSVGWWRSRRRP